MLPVLALALGLGAPACPATPATAGFERRMLDLVNGERADRSYSDETHGRAAPLAWNPALAAAARCHSLTMLRGGRFSHAGAGDGDLAARLARAAIAWRACAENIALADTVAQAERMFLAEPPHQANHRGNLLNPAYTQIGIGIAVGPDGMLYITQDFIRP